VSSWGEERREEQRRERGEKSREDEEEKKRRRNTEGEYRVVGVIFGQRHELFRLGRGRIMVLRDRLKGEEGEREE
jgi:hypothetical protein